MGPSQPLPCFCLHLETIISIALKISTKTNLITKRNSQTDCIMVSEPRKQSMAWMETDYSKHIWEIKWRLEYYVALGIMSETAPTLRKQLLHLSPRVPFLTNRSIADQLCRSYRKVNTKSGWSSISKLKQICIIVRGSSASQLIGWKRIWNFLGSLA